jgi:hypothetical protein
MKRFWHGFRRREPKKKCEKSPASFLIPPELAGLLVSAFTKIVGSTVKERALRAILTAIIAGLGAWFGFSPSESWPEYSRPNTTATQPYTAPVAKSPD